MKRFFAQRLAAVALAAVALSGCYQSERLLLNPREAVAPLAPGVHKTAGGGEALEVEVSVTKDGWQKIHLDNKDDMILFTPLPGAPAGEQRYALAFAENVGFVYGLAYRRGGQVYIDLPLCDGGEALDIALRHGATAERPGVIAPVCTFKDSAALVAALTDFANRPGDRGDLTRLPAAE